MEMVSLAKVLSAPINAITINATIRPYSMAVAPELSSRIALKSLFVFTVTPREYGPTVGFSRKSPNERFPLLPELKDFPTEIHVVAAALTTVDGRFLLQRRGPGGRHGGLWEFPGGKVDDGETPENALIREIEEELGLSLDPDSLLLAGSAREESAGNFPAIVMSLYIIGAWSGDPVGRQGQKWGWFGPDEAALLPMPPVDVELLDRLRMTSS